MKKKILAPGHLISLSRIICTIVISKKFAPELKLNPHTYDWSKLRELVGMGGHEARKGDGQVESHRHVPLPVIEKAVDLLVRLSAALAQEDLRVLQNGSIDGHESEGPKHPREAGLGFLLQEFLLGQGVTEAPQRLRFDDRFHGTPKVSPANPECQARWHPATLDEQPAITIILS